MPKSHLMELILWIYSGITAYVHVSYNNSNIVTQHTKRERENRGERKTEKQKDRRETVERERKDNN